MKGRTWGVILVALVWLVAAGCAGSEFVPSGPVIHPRDGAVPEEKGEETGLKVLTFSWRYLKETNQIRVTGQAQNLSDKPFQGGRIIVEAFDQYNYHLGTVESFLQPTYLSPGRIGRFDFYLHRGSWVQALHLRYRFETRY